MQLQIQHLHRNLRLAQIARELKEADVQAAKNRRALFGTLGLRKAKKLEDDALKAKHIDTARTSDTSSKF